MAELHLGFEFSLFIKYPICARSFQQFSESRAAVEYSFAYVWPVVLKNTKKAAIDGCSVDTECNVEITLDSRLFRVFTGSMMVEYTY